MRGAGIDTSILPNLGRTKQSLVNLFKVPIFYKIGSLPGIQTITDYYSAEIEQIAHIKPIKKPSGASASLAQTCE